MQGIYKFLVSLTYIMQSCCFTIFSD